MAAPRNRCLARFWWAALAAGCSVLNRAGPEDTCAGLQNGAVNDCRDGIIATCIGAQVTYRVCDDKSACEQSWQTPGAYRCGQSDPPPQFAGTTCSAASPSCPSTLRCNFAGSYCVECIENANCPPTNPACANYACTGGSTPDSGTIGADAGTDSAVPSGGVPTTCGATALAVNTAGCAQCVEGGCCGVGGRCGGDAQCQSCVRRLGTGSPCPSGMNATYDQLGSCLQSTCASSCGGG